MTRLRRAARGAEGLPSGQRQQTVNLPTDVFVGSNPTPSTSAADPAKRVARLKRVGRGNDAERGCSSMVELQPSKLATWVRFPSPAPAPRRL
jgi:hypothetical protein